MNLFLLFQVTKEDGFLDRNSFFEEQKTLIDKGEKALSASDIQQFSYNSSSGQVHAKIHASVKNHLYTVKVNGFLKFMLTVLMDYIVISNENP